VLHLPCTASFAKRWRECEFEINANQLLHALACLSATMQCEQQKRFVWMCLRLS
jgi:hypothetical protein